MMDVSQQHQLSKDDFITMTRPARQPEKTFFYENIVKRSADFILALLGLIISSPLYITVYIAIRCEDHKPAIFKQRRIGYKGKSFIIYKFRSMKTNAESTGKPALYHQNDCRLTKVGRFIREHHIDELPQLWNVIKGDMSFVGPRPERKFYIDKIMRENSDYKKLYAIRPGLFSSATLYNGYTDTLEKMLIRLQMDLDYLNNRSFFLDCKIIFLSFIFIMSGKKF